MISKLIIQNSIFILLSHEPRLRTTFPIFISEKHATTSCNHLYYQIYHYISNKSMMLMKKSYNFLFCLNNWIITVYFGLSVVYLHGCNNTYRRTNEYYLFVNYVILQNEFILCLETLLCFEITTYETFNRLLGEIDRRLHIYIDYHVGINFVYIQ